MQYEVLSVSYHYTLVAMSFVVAALGSYTALAATAAAGRRGQNQLDWFNIGLAGLSLGGIAIWSMHFVGMLAWDIEIGVGYRWLETGVSLVAAVIVSTLALGYVAARPKDLKRLFVAGPLAGLGVAAMHYLGMYAMSFSGYFDWNPGLVAGSIVIAVVAATAALWLAFRTRTRGHRVAASIVMAAAVCSMHYTGMVAASVVCTSRAPNTMLAGLLRPSDLSSVVLVVAVGIAALIGLDLLMQRAFGRRAAAAQ